MIDNQRGREWAAHNIRSVDHFVVKNESKIRTVQRLSDLVGLVAGLALLRKRFKR